MPEGGVPSPSQGRWRPYLKGGVWVPGVVLVWSLFSLVGDIAGLARVLRPEVWRRLTHPDGPMFHPMWGWVLVSEFAASVVLVIACGAVLALYLARHADFPWAMAVLLGVNAVWSGVDWLGAGAVAGSLPPEMARVMLDSARFSLLVGILLAGMIPWLLKSRPIRDLFSGPVPG
ncbi:MAG: hypothetical protein OEY97_00600 [Nitrospirota bacterium]|nr:hypothetical protein [Nitrospirota bacterium]